MGGSSSKGSLNVDVRGAILQAMLSSQSCRMQLLAVSEIDAEGERFNLNGCKNLDLNSSALSGGIYCSERLSVCDLAGGDYCRNGETPPATPVLQALGQTSNSLKITPKKASAWKNFWSSVSGDTNNVEMKDDVNDIVTRFNTNSQHCTVDGELWEDLKFEGGNLTCTQGGVFTANSYVTADGAECIASALSEATTGYFTSTVQEEKPVNASYTYLLAGGVGIVVAILAVVVLNVFKPKPA